MELSWFDQQLEMFFFTATDVLVNKTPLYALMIALP